MCNHLDIDVWEVINAAATKPFGFTPFYPGPGLGGHCIPVDPWFIVHSAPDESKIIQIARKINRNRTDIVYKKILKHIKAAKRKESIACLGIGYKANIGDTRESPAVEIIKKLDEDQLGELLIIDPHVKTLPKVLKNRKHLTLTSDLGQALDNSDVILKLVGHREFENIESLKFPDKLILNFC